MVNTVSPSHQPFCTNLAHSFFNKKIGLQTSANVVHATGGEDSTPRTRDTDAHVSRVAHMRHIINAHSLAQDPTVKHMWIVCPRAHQKPLMRLMFRGTLLESQFSSPNPYSSFCCTPPPVQTSLLNTGMSMNPCVTPQGGHLFGRTAEQSPLSNRRRGGSAGRGELCSNRDQDQPRWCVTCARTPLSCTMQTLLPTNRKSTPGRTSTARECSS